MNSRNLASPGQYLTFILRGQSYAVPIESVREINRMCEIAPVPQTPPYVAGVINLRGKVIPVIDLRLRFDFPLSTITKESCIIVIESKHGQVGTIVDAVSGVVDLRQDEIEPPPHLGNDENLSFIIGMGKTAQEVIILVDTVHALESDVKFNAEILTRASA